MSDNLFFAHDLICTNFNVIVDNLGTEFAKLARACWVFTYFVPGRFVACRSLGVSACYPWILVECDACQLRLQDLTRNILGLGAVGGETGVRKFSMGAVAERGVLEYLSRGKLGAFHVSPSQTGRKIVPHFGYLMFPFRVRERFNY